MSCVLGHKPIFGTLSAPGNKGRKGQGKQTKTTAPVTSDEEESEVERLMGDSDTNEPPAPPRPRPVRRLPRNGDVNPLSGPEDTDKGGADLIQDTPTSRPRPKATYRKKSPVKSPTKSPGKSPARSNTLSDVEVNGVTPATPRKRGHSEVDTTIPEEQVADVEGDLEGALSSGPQLTPSADIQIRRKRVRH